MVCELYPNNPPPFFFKDVLRLERMYCVTLNIGTLLKLLSKFVQQVGVCLSLLYL